MSRAGDKSMTYAINVTYGVRLQLNVSKSLTPLLTESDVTWSKEILGFVYGNFGEIGDPLHNLQRHFVSNAVSNVKTLLDSVVNLSGLMV
jgi:hypothetical protein